MADGNGDTERWREDFPVRWDVDHYLTRRELAKFLTLGSALLVGATGAIAAFGRMGVEEVRTRQWIASSAALEPNGSLLFRYPTPDDPCIAVRTAAGELRAYSQVCTHLSCAVRHLPDRDQFLCPCHRGFFAVSDGRPLAGPPTRRLPRILLEEHDGNVYAVGIEV